MASISINGNVYSGRNILINNGKIIIDGKAVDTDDKVITIQVTGDVQTIQTESSDVTITGNVGEASTVSGDINIKGEVRGSVSSVSGDVSAKTILGSVSTVSGDINR